ncbi:MAG: calcium-binding protein [Anaeromyxobacter sp.]
MLDGGDANDLLTGNAGDDLLIGGEGNDTLNGGAGADQLLGGADNDDLTGAAGADVLDGGSGDDTLDGGTGNDVFVVRRGGGADTITDSDTTSGNLDTLRFEDVASTEVSAVQRVGNDLVLRFGAAQDRVTVKNHFYSASWRVETIQFSDGVTWSDGVIKAKVVTIGDGASENISGYADGSNRMYGNGGSDTLSGGNLADMLDGGDANDSLTGNTGDDLLVGGEGNDTLNGGAGADQLLGGADTDDLTGGAGADVLDGGSGDDTLDGGTGNDVYVVRRGGGADTITDSDSTTGNLDTLRFEDVASTDVSAVQRVGNDLVIRYGSAQDRVTVKNHFYSATWGVESIQFSDGVTWDRAVISRSVGGHGHAHGARHRRNRRGRPAHWYRGRRGVQCRRWR